MTPLIDLPISNLKYLTNVISFFSLSSGPFPKNMLNWSQQQAHSESDLMNILHQGAMTMTGRPHKNSAGKQDMMSAHGYSEYQMGHQDLQQQLRSQGVTLISE